MARGRDPEFDGSYETSRYANDSVEDALERGIDKGIYVSPTESGGVQKLTQTDKGDRVDVWEPGEKGNYPHYGIDSDGEFFKK